MTILEKIDDYLKVFIYDSIFKEIFKEENQ